MFCETLATFYYLFGEIKLKKKKLNNILYAQTERTLRFVSVFVSCGLDQELERESQC